MWQMDGNEMKPVQGVPPMRRSVAASSSVGKYSKLVFLSVSRLFFVIISIMILDPFTKNNNNNDIGLKLVSPFHARFLASLVY